MSKIAIIGVDGSGKTVLMSALGAHFESPDAKGRFLSAKDQSTFSIVKRTVGLMRKGQWPGATEMDTASVLRWDFCRVQDEQVLHVAELEFLDYAGEVYRLAFGKHKVSETAPYQEQIDTLRKHILAADSIFLLINLKDIISGDESNPRTLEMLWVTKGILDFLAEAKRIDRVTLVFTQAASYRETMAACGGDVGTYKKYLPHLYPHYPKLPLLAVSAVSEVDVGDDGYEVPAPNFTSSGLDLLLETMLANSQAREREQARREALRREQVCRELERDAQQQFRRHRGVALHMLLAVGMMGWGLYGSYLLRVRAGAVGAHGWVFLAGALGLFVLNRGIVRVCQQRKDWHNGALGNLLCVWGLLSTGCSVFGLALLCWTSIGWTAALLIVGILFVLFALWVRLRD